MRIIDISYSLPDVLQLCRCEIVGIVFRYRLLQLGESLCDGGPRILHVVQDGGGNKEIEKRTFDRNQFRSWNEVVAARCRLSARRTRILLFCGLLAT